jgi:membrane protease YdiL (CAAX protease family)
MTDDVRMRKLMNRLGTVLILNSVLIQTLGGIPTLLTEFFWTESTPAQVANADILYSLIYLFSFMFPVGIFALISRRLGPQPMRLSLRVDGATPLMIAAGMAVVTAAALVNSILFSWVDLTLLDAKDYDTPLKFMLGFVSIALVPAVCEEFLFRGCVLSNLLPYGRTTAIVGSALLFALMHSNWPQYLYTFCAGIVLGAIYTVTGSIWPGMFLHLFNNFYSLILEAGASMFDERTYELVTLLSEAGILLAGLASAAFLALRYRGRAADPDRGAVPTFRAALTKSPAKLFFSPMIVIFACISAALATFVILMAAAMS